MSIDNKVNLTKGQAKILKDCLKKGIYAVGHEGVYYCTLYRVIPCEYRVIIPVKNGAGARCDNPVLLELEEPKIFKHDNDIPYSSGE